MTAPLVCLLNYLLFAILLLYVYRYYGMVTLIMRLTFSKSMNPLINISRGYKLVIRIRCSYKIKLKYRSCLYFRGYE
jgi:hypothetical protein